MSKAKTIFYCQNCGAQSPKWLGRCPSCGEWNTYVEEVIQQGSKPEDLFPKKKEISPVKISEIPFVAGKEEGRIILPDNELNRILGGGLVPGSVVLFGGEPGIGKSTLLLQVALDLKEHTVLYISGEESLPQIRMRAERIRNLLAQDSLDKKENGNPPHAWQESNCFIMNETSLENIFLHIQTLQPHLVIIDSIQTLTSMVLDAPAGSVSQTRHCTGTLVRFAKQSGTPVFLIGHITKDGLLAGPKVLEHMVDVVLQFEGDRHHVYRLLRSLKNRFGSTNELGIYEMTSSGLRQVSNPSEILITAREEPVSGVAIAVMMESLRPLLIEVQALVSSAVYGVPQRSATGFDVKRLSMLLAVLEKRCGFRLGAKDVFLNIAGGIRAEDPALDLAVICSVLSSSENIPIATDRCFAAEVGLSGEIRPISRIDARIREAEKLGFSQIFISRYNLKGLNIKEYDIKIVPVSKVEELFARLFTVRTR